MTVIVVMGVAGSGKTTVGTMLAERLGVEYGEADTFHPPANIAKMDAGIPLTDADRTPWLRTVAEWTSAHDPGGGVVSCSALKRRYRDVLRAAAGIWFLHLHGGRDVIAGRISARAGHFMPVSLLDSQFADLEPLSADEEGMMLEVAEAPQRIVDIAAQAFTSYLGGAR
ncbi:gluconokinase [Nocardia flavorosea]|uniref:Gluconokinase n=1 Tax=Nocardia flavorosea TaxID=53429 RepID=A0A846YHI3_9NOCA|nr:gluconokinase [Nocardia flavorosea]NKY58373.1 gluconokinase [Nocardia flavorosea]